MSFGNDFTVLTFNIMHAEFAFIDDDRYPWCAKEHLAWSHRLPLIRQIISESKADIVCLQEADAETVEADFAGLGYAIEWQKHKKKLKALEKWREEQKSNPVAKKPNTIICATLYKPERFEAVTTDIGSRVMTVELHELSTGRHLWVTNAHLEALATPQACLARLTHVTNLVKREPYHLVCGDFNDFPDSPPVKMMEERGFNSIWERVRPPSYTLYTRYWQNVVDYVFFTPALRFEAAESHPRSKIPCVNFPSDHIPVRVTFRFSL